jgi:hypothetical protein
MYILTADLVYMGHGLCTVVIVIGIVIVIVVVVVVVDVDVVVNFVLSVVYRQLFPRCSFV